MLNILKARLPKNVRVEIREDPLHYAYLIHFRFGEGLTTFEWVKSIRMEHIKYMSGANGSDFKHHMEMIADIAMKEAKNKGVNMGDTPNDYEEYKRMVQLQALNMQKQNPYNLIGQSQSGLGALVGGWVENLGIPQYPPSSPYQGVNVPTIEKPQRKRTGSKFMRLSKEVHIEEGGMFEEPLDKLRLTVARWLQKTDERMPSFEF